MAVVASDYINVVRRATELDCVAPSDLALITRYFETAEPRDELLHESHASTLRKLWRAAGVDATPVEPPDETFPEVSESAFDLLLPTIFVGSLLLSEDPDGVSLALGVVANYVTDFFKGITGERKVRLDVVVEEEPDRKYRRIRYEGPPAGVHTIVDIVRDTART